MTRRALIAGGRPHIIGDVLDWLRQAEFDWIHCTNPLDALGVFPGAAVDLVIAELDTPIWGGSQLARRIKATAKGRYVPVMLTTLEPVDLATWLDLTMAGVHSVLALPATAREIDRHVQLALGNAEAGTPVRLRVDYPDLDAYLRDFHDRIRRHGTLIAGDRSLGLGRRLRIQLRLPYIEQDLVVNGEVRYSTRGAGGFRTGVRLAFKEFDDEVYAEVLGEKLERCRRAAVCHPDAKERATLTGALEHVDWMAFAVAEPAELPKLVRGVLPDVILAPAAAFTEGVAAGLKETVTAHGHTAPVVVALGEPAAATGVDATVTPPTSRDDLLAQLGRAYPGGLQSARRRG